MKPLSDEFTAFIGIDWADRKHDICLQGAHSDRREFSRIEHKVALSSHQAAVRALAFKWLRILYRCWQTRTPYDESTYLNALKKRGSPLLNQLGMQT